METGQWRVTRYGLPRLVAHATLGPRDRITAHPGPIANPFVRRAHPATRLIDTMLIASALKEPQPIELQQVRRTGDESLFNSLTSSIITKSTNNQSGALEISGRAQGRPIACLAWSSAPRHWAAGTRHRLERGSAAAQHPLHRL